jgi:hypothetical protein
VPEERQRERERERERERGEREEKMVSGGEAWGDDELARMKGTKRTGARTPWRRRSA